MQVTAENLSIIRGELRDEFDDVFEGVPTIWDQIATEVPSTSSGNNYAWLGDIPGVREWIGDRFINQLDEQAYRIENRKFEGTVAIKRTDIEDDELGSYTVRTRQLADQAAKHPDQLVFEAVREGFTTRCFDGQNFFDTEHPVGPEDGSEVASNFQSGTGAPWFLLDTSATLKPFIYQKRTDVEFGAMDDATSQERPFMRDEYVFGTRHRGNAGYGYWQLAFASKAALTPENVIAARLAMESLVDTKGEKLGVSPTVLLVGASNRAAAEKIVKAEKIGDEYNTLKGAFELIVAPRLD